MKTIVLFLSLSLLVGCQTLTSKEKSLLTVAGGMMTGALVGAMIAPDDADIEGTIATNAVLGAIAAGGYSYYFQEDDGKNHLDVGSLRKELELYKSVELPKSQQFHLEAFKFQQEGKLPSYFNYGKSNCGGKILKLCSSSIPGELSNCSQPKLLYLDKNWAIDFVAYYSPDSCWTPSQYSVIPGFNEYLGEALKTTYRKFKK